MSLAMNDLTPKSPYRPLIWPDAVLDMHDLLHDWPHDVYIVGGAVRDALKGLQIHDIDLATSGSAVKLARKIANHFPNGGLFIMDAERDVARAIFETMHGLLHVDVAHFRGENDADVLADLVDRDFTINAMMVDLRGDLSLVVDPLNGQQDVAQKIIRRCSPRSIVSDPIRALRAVRQSTQLGFRIERDTLADVRAEVNNLYTTSPERVRDEFFKVLGLSRASVGLRVMDTLGLLGQVLPYWDNLEKTERDYRLLMVEKMGGLLAGFMPHGVDNLASDFGFGVALVQLNGVRPQLAEHIAHLWPNDRSQRALLMLMILLQGVGHDKRDMAELAQHLRISNDERDRMRTALRVDALPDTDDVSLHEFWYDIEAAGVDAVLLMLVRFLATHGVYLNMHQDDWLALVERAQVTLETYYKRYDSVVSPPPLIDGHVLMTTFDLKPSPQIADLLRSVRLAQVAGDVSTTDEALDFVQRQLQQ